MATQEQLQSIQDAITEMRNRIATEGITDSAGNILSQPTTQPQQQGNTYEELYNQLKTYLDKLVANGQVINPNIEITPEKIAEFTAQAQTEIDPYYASQLKLAREDLLSSIGYSKQQILANEQELERKYGTSVRKLGEQSAEQGFAQSGIRQRGEQELAADTQSQINQGRTMLGNTVGTAARTFAQQYGAQNIETPAITAAPVVQAGNERFLPGQAIVSGQASTEQPLYQLSPDIYDSLVGSKQYEQTAAKRTRVSELEKAFRTTQQNQQLRQLSL